MDFVALCERLGVPSAHGTESAHDGELVPDHAATLLCDTEEGLADEGTVVVDGIVSLDAPVAVVVGDEDEGAVGADAAYGVDKAEVALSEDGGVEIGSCCIVDANAEDYEVGRTESEVGGEEGALGEVVGSGGAVDANGMAGDSRPMALEEESGEGEGLSAVAGEDDAEGVDGFGELVGVAP